MGVIRSNRFERQDGWIPRTRLLKESVTVIGTGGIGRQVALPDIRWIKQGTSRVIVEKVQLDRGNQNNNNGGNVPEAP
jgi:phosphoglycerate dehydrogenase-like enzyme